MGTEPVRAFGAITEERPTPWFRWPVGLILVIHGLVHIMGVVLLLELAEPGDLTYAVARPEPGTALGVGFAILWGLAAVLFVISGYQMIRGDHWSALVVVASLISLVAVGAMVTAAPIGAVISALTLVIGLWYAIRDRSPR